MRVLCLFLVGCLAIHAINTQAVSAALSAAVLANPEGFAKAVGQVGKDAVSVAQSVKSMVANTSSDNATIINLTDNGDCTWHTYNEVAPIKLFTTMQSYMGPNAIVQVKSLGWGSMTTFCNNTGNPYHLERNGLYTWDGQSMKLVVKKDAARRMFMTRRRRMQAVSAALSAAVLANPEGFAKAVGGLATDAVSVAQSVKSMVANTGSDSATIINLSDNGDCTWHTYNEVAPIK